MKANFDRMRRNATIDMNCLYNIIEEIIDDDYITDSQEEEITKCFNNAAYSVDIFNCLEYENDKNFNSMDDLEIRRLKV